MNGCRISKEKRPQRKLRVDHNQGTAGSENYTFTRRTPNNLFETRVAGKVIWLEETERTEMAGAMIGGGDTNGVVQDDGQQLAPNDARLSHTLIEFRCNCREMHRNYRHINTQVWAIKIGHEVHPEKTKFTTSISHPSGPFRQYLNSSIANPETHIETHHERPLT
jgi:hypothetical protein